MSIHPDPNISLRLNNIQELLSHLDNPQKSIGYTVHIAGTNGKGSTGYFIEQLLLHNHPKLKVARYSSPHITNLEERFTINSQNIPTETLELLLQKIDLIIDTHSLDISYFERLTAAAFLYFHQSQVDISIIEVGLGGRLDATNVINADLSLITNIDYDHQDYLGNTIEQIAAEKAGILKPHKPYITSAKNQQALNVILKASPESIHLPFKPNWDNLNSPDYLPHYQYTNLSLALNAVEYICTTYLQTPPQKNIPSLKCLPGRFQKITLQNKSIILDGSHNTHGIEALLSSLRQHYPHTQYTWLIGILKSKNYQAILNQIIQLHNTQKIILTSPCKETESHNLDTISEYIHSLNPNIKVITQGNQKEALNIMLQESNQNTNIIAGSLYLIGNILKMTKK